MLPRQLRTCWLCWNVLSLWKQNTIKDFNGTKQITCNQAWLLVRHINHKEQDSWPWNENITQLTKLWKPGLLSDVFEFMLINILLLSKTAREGLTAHSVSKTEWKHFYNLGASSMESSKNMRNWQLNRNWPLNCWDPLLKPSTQTDETHHWNQPLIHFVQVQIQPLWQFCNFKLCDKLIQAACGFCEKWLLSYWCDN